MSPATSAQVRRRGAARKRLQQRKEELDAERRRRDERETDAAADYLLSGEDRESAKNAVRDAEIAMGRAVEALVGELRVPYARASDLLGEPEVELKRLRQVAMGVERRTGESERSRGHVSTPADKLPATSAAAATLGDKVSIIAASETNSP